MALVAVVLRLSEELPALLAAMLALPLVVLALVVQAAAVDTPNHLVTMEDQTEALAVARTRVLAKDRLQGVHGTPYCMPAVAVEAIDSSLTAEVVALVAAELGAHTRLTMINAIQHMTEQQTPEAVAVV